MTRNSSFQNGQKEMTDQKGRISVPLATSSIIPTSSPAARPATYPPPSMPSFKFDSRFTSRLSGTINKKKPSDTGYGIVDAWLVDDSASRRVSAYQGFFSPLRIPSFVSFFLWISLRWISRSGFGFGGGELTEAFWLSTTGGNIGAAPHPPHQPTAEGKGREGGGDGIVVA
ncbi:hypothetical protein B0H12DRAFT_1080315 [Mycena haematopus]|nr:hypothetical protein B0H12DRAFT_1080315 [Mycena haematopus]